MASHENPQQQPGPESVNFSDSSPEILTPAKTSAAVPIRRATGPRTLQGKRSSKHNATKHGIFSKVAILKSADKGEFESLLCGLREALQPQGALEELIVEKLATIAWRQKRLLLAECAEIKSSTKFLKWDQQNRLQEEAERIGASPTFSNEEGLIWKSQNPAIFERCVELLIELRDGIEADRFNKEWDTSILRKIYGDPDSRHLRETLQASYFLWLNTAETSEAERKREGFAIPEKCKQNVLQEIDAEIRRLRNSQKARRSIDSERTRLEILRRRVPDSPGLDRLLDTRPV